VKNIENSNVVHFKITKEIDVNCVKFIGHLVMKNNYCLQFPIETMGWKPQSIFEIARENPTKTYLKQEMNRCLAYKGIPRHQNNNTKWNISIWTSTFGKKLQPNELAGPCKLCKGNWMAENGSC
jgi:hypothetical protein